MISATASSAADPAELFDIASDVEAWGDRLPTVTSVRHVAGPRPMAVGSRYEVVQPGIPAAVYEVTELDPGRRFVWQARGAGMVATAGHTVVADGTGSRLDLTVEWSGPLGRLFRAVVAKRAQVMVDTEAEVFARLAAV
ncbi:SRPBCC family protein [Propionibacteriaceae bacterium Y2011]|uniref:SRPBCC family protein n=1 Tax=Microlunatus sp. Y2014 TaxID=3418488 RepID=UPI003B496B52